MDYKLERERLVKTVGLVQQISVKQQKIYDTAWGDGKLNYAGGKLAVANAVELALDDGNFAKLEKLAK